MKNLLLEIKEAVDQQKTKPHAESLEVEIIKEFENRCDQIIAQGIEAEPPPPEPQPQPQPVSTDIGYLVVKSCHFLARYFLAGL